MQISGSLTTTGSITSLGGITGSIAATNGVISGSSQLTSSFDTRYLVTGSVTSSINALNTATSSYETKGRSIVSGSSQLTSSFDTRYIVSGSVSAVPTGTISGSAQITAFGFVSSSAATPAWTSAGATTITATTTSPTKGTTTSDNIGYRQIGAKEWEVVMTYIQTAFTGGANGSGDYLITLPNGLSFDTTLPSQQITTTNIGTSTYALMTYIIPSGGGLINNGGLGGQVYPIVYSATKFRILTTTWAGSIQCWGSGYYSIGGDTPKVQLTFRFTST
jgi:hypothetical protein